VNETEARTRSSSALDDPRVVAALDEYMSAVEAGNRPDRDEFLTRHAAVADVLAACLDGMEMLQGLEPSVDASGMARGCTLGDFRLIREVGRGGMGIVYEAEQMSLGRRVALKMLPFAATMDGRQLQRFKNEAHAAAQLHHTNIVPIFGVGCERGVHFYAMQYIEGHSLADVIVELRGQAEGAATKPRQSPSPHAEATVDGPAGQRLDWPSSLSAESETKPIAGLSTERSAKGPAYFRTVAELGIQAAEALDCAHQQGIVHRDIKPANLLIDTTGRLWVTDFGLAQVQSDARLTMTGDLVGTLRYMSPEQALAKRVVVDHRTDVYSLGATLYELLTLQPAFTGTDRQELLRQIAFEEPRRPRRINKTIPPELEIIVLKALEKNATDRYATAQKLADDLRHWLDDRPIQARRPSTMQRLSKWARRHQALVRLATACLVLAVVGLGVATFLIGRARRETERQRDAAERQREEALRKRRQARRAVDTMYTRVAEKWLQDEPGLERLQREFLEEALEFYRQFAAEDEADLGVGQETGNAHARVGGILSTLGNRKEAAAEYGRAIAILEPLAAEHPGNADLANDLAQSHHGLAIVQGWTGDKRSAEANERRAIDIWERLVRNYPNVPRYGRKLTGAYNGLIGTFLNDSTRHEELEKGLLRAQEIMERLVADDPKSAENHRGLGGTLSNRALLKLVQGKPAEGRPPLEKAIDAQKAALGLNPKDKQARIFLRNHYAVLAKVFPPGELPKALATAEEALSTAQELTRQSPDVPQYRGMLADSHKNLGEIHKALGNFREAVGAFRNAIGVLEAMPASAFSGHDRDLLNSSRVSLGSVLNELGEEHQAVELYEKVLQSNPADAPAANNLALVLADASDHSLRNPVRALELARAAVGQLPKSPGAQSTLGLAHYRNCNYEAALNTLKKACELNGGRFGPAEYFLAMTCWQLKKSEEARAMFERAAKRARQFRPTRELTRAHAEVAELLGIQDGGAAEPELVPLPKEADGQSGMSLDFIDRPARVARDEALVFAIHQQVQHLQDRSADKCGFALRLDSGREGIAPSKELDARRFHHAALRPTTVGVADLQPVEFGEPQVLHHGTRQYQSDRARIDDAGNGPTPYLIRRNRPVLRPDKVFVIGDLKLHAKSSHAVGSFAAHGRTPTRTSSG